MGNSDDNKKIPFITVATTAGTGSEITGAAVLDREDIDNKAGTKPFVWSDYSFVDPNYIKTCDAKLMQGECPGCSAPRTGALYRHRQQRP